MYHAHWGFTRSPFIGGESPLFYQGESQIEALARLRYVAEQPRHALVVGPRGVGKSLLIRQFCEQRRREGRVAAALCLAGLSPREALWQIAGGLALAPRPDDDAGRLFRRLSDHAAAAASRSGVALLLLDDMDQAGADVRSHVRRLLSLGGPSPWVALVLIASQRTAGRIGDDLLRAVDLRIDVEPWSETDATGYLQHALIEAGAVRPVFEDEAACALYALTDGVPRQVNRLADHALLGAAAEGRETVDAAMVEAAHDALGWTTAAGADS